MKTKTLHVLSMISVLAMLAAPTLAHHGYAAYDMQTTKTLKGTVTNFMMANPHSQIAVDVKGADGNVEHWVLESLGVRGMEELGFQFDSLKAGDEVTITYNPAKGGSHAGLFVNLTLPDGKVLPKRAGSNGN
ncbi:MAG: DUF6152 family protein [Candidatus Acidiferrales bacterium]